MMKQGRRSFLKTILIGGLAITVAPLVRIRDAFADLVKNDDPMVVALGYVENAKKSKLRKDKKANCRNCQFYADTTGKEKQAKCQLIPSGEVVPEGWCKSYAKRQAG